MSKLLVIIILFVIAAIYDLITTYIGIYKYGLKENFPFAPMRAAPITTGIILDLIILAPSGYALYQELVKHITVNVEVAFWICLVGTCVRFTAGTINLFKINKFKNQSK